MLRPVLKFTFSLFMLLTWINFPLFGQDAFFEKADDFLKQHVKNTRVDYEKINQNPADLNDLIRIIQSYPVSEKDQNTRKAFWINAYNLIAIHSISKHYPIDSPLDIPDLFTQKNITVETEKLSLDAIEKIKLLKQFEDARIHFAIVCGAISCSPIHNGAYFPESIDNQLDKQVSKAINDPFF